MAALVRAAPLDARVRQHAPARRARGRGARAAARRGDTSSRTTASMSRALRLAAEQRLQAPATCPSWSRPRRSSSASTSAPSIWSCHLGSPRSIATLLQRVGRSGHGVGATPKGRLFALTRDELLECAALGPRRAARRPRRDRRARGAARHPRAANRRRRSRPRRPPEAELSRYSSAPRRTPTLADPRRARAGAGDAGRRRRAAARPHGAHLSPGRHRRRAARRGAAPGSPRSRRAARFPTTATTTSCWNPTRRRSAASTRTSRSRARRARSSSSATRRGGSGASKPARVRGRGCPRRAADGPVLVRGGARAHPGVIRRGRRTARRHRRTPRRPPGDSRRGSRPRPAWIPTAPRSSRRGLYRRRRRAALGACRAQETIIAERFFDEVGRDAARAARSVRRPHQPRVGTRAAQAVLPDVRLRAAGRRDGRRHRPDSLGQPHSFPLDSLFGFVRTRTARGGRWCRRCSTPMFETRWRWNVTRSLARAAPPGRQAACRRISSRCARPICSAPCFRRRRRAARRTSLGHREPPDHPLVSETIRNCLVEAMDIDGLRTVLGRARERRSIAPCWRATTVEPSAAVARSCSTRTPTRSWTTRRSRSAGRARCNCAAAARRHRPAASARSTPPRSRSPPRRSRRPSAMRTNCTTRCSALWLVPEPMGLAFGDPPGSMRCARPAARRGSSGTITRRGSRPSGSAPRARSSARPWSPIRRSRRRRGRSPSSATSRSRRSSARISIIAGRVATRELAGELGLPLADVLGALLALEADGAICAARSRPAHLRSHEPRATRSPPPTMASCSPTSSGATAACSRASIA